MYFRSLIDGDASLSCISQSLVKRLGLRTVPLVEHRTVKLAAYDTTAPTTHCILANFCLTSLNGSFTFRTTVFVIDLNIDQDLILGCPWLDHYSVTLEYGDERRVIVKSPTPGTASKVAQ